MAVSHGTTYSFHPLSQETLLWVACMNQFLPLSVSLSACLTLIFETVSLSLGLPSAFVSVSLPHRLPYSLTFPISSPLPLPSPPLFGACTKGQGRGQAGVSRAGREPLGASPGEHKGSHLHGGFQDPHCSPVAGLFAGGAATSLGGG